MTLFVDLLRALASADVEFILAGGAAATVHGAIRSTQDIDIVYNRSVQNLQRLVIALGPHHPYLRGAPPGLPFRLDLETLKGGLNFTLVTDLGWIDLLGELAGGGRYEDLISHVVMEEVFGIRFHVLDLDTLIHTKRSAGRPKDFEGIAELEFLRDRSRPRPAN